MVIERRRREIGRFGVSTVVEDHAAASAAPPTVSSIVARHDVLIAIAIGGLLLAIGAGLLLATSDHLADPIVLGLQVVVIVMGWFSAALYWLARRPGNWLGLFLLALAVGHAAIAVLGVSQPQLRSTAVLADSALLFLVLSVVFAFPEGRIASRFEWVLLGALALERLESYVPSLLFSPVVFGSAPFAGCSASTSTPARVRPVQCDASAASRCGDCRLTWKA